MPEKLYLPPNAVDVSVGLAWSGDNRQDLDLQALVVSRQGSILESAYYNNAKAVRGAVLHSGDSLDGTDAGIDEKILVRLNRLTEDVLLIVFLVCNHSGRALSDAGAPIAEVYDESGDEKQKLQEFRMDVHPTASVGFPVALALEADGWTFFTLSYFVDKRARHFMDCLPDVVEVIRLFIPQAVDPGKLAFSMRKGCVVDFPSNQAAVVCGLGWDTLYGKIDLDASCILLTATGEVIDCAFFSNLKILGGAIKHSGDNLTGEGEGDDEQISVELDRVTENVHHVYFVINIYTAHKTFMQVANPYCRVCDLTTNTELCRYQLTECPNSSALVIGRLTRDTTNRWAFTALGHPGHGTIWRDTLPEVRKLLHISPKELWRSQTSLNQNFNHPQVGISLEPIQEQKTQEISSGYPSRVREESERPGKCCPLS